MDTRWELLAPATRRLLRTAPHPARAAPQLAVAEAPRTITDDGSWVHERKLDGVRLLVHVDRGDVRMITRTGADRARSFPELDDALRALGSDDVVVDGEVVALHDEHDSFERLQRRLGDPSRATGHADVPVHLYLFDVLHLDGHDLRALPLVARKQLLASLRFVEPIRFLEHATGDLAVHLAAACRQGWEGLIAKRADAPYRPGRSPDWRKLKCQRTGRFVVGGWTPVRGTATGVGALLIGRHTPDGLRYAGRVGSGIDGATARTLGRHFQRTEVPDSPFADRLAPTPGGPRPRFVVPHLVVEVRYTEWTDARRLRHPTLLAVRPDLDVEDATGDTVA